MKEFLGAVGGILIFLIFVAVTCMSDAIVVRIGEWCLSCLGL